MEEKINLNIDSDINQEIREPKMFSVVMYNDNFTSMDFVVEILIKVFHKTQVEANNIMLEIHKNGKGVAGTYTYDIALTKKNLTDKISEENEFPLKLTVEEA